ncbi:glycogen synthase kinase-3 beta-like [Narcine bancroftii]|uniref:glycogen synthase kinase-3 beta-like n=1 Tax=Narcine bancroftii TaxID=1343680 RepID=UPI00383227A4
MRPACGNITGTLSDQRHCVWMRPAPMGDSNKATTVLATLDHGPYGPKEVPYADVKIFGNGTFSVVNQARMVDGGELISIKKILQGKRFKKTWPPPSPALARGWSPLP